MEFGEVTLDKAASAILAHSVRLPGGILRKGIVLGKAEVERLEAAGIDRVTVARLGNGDLSENEAATRIAEALVSDRLEASSGNTGRANLRATVAGLVRIDEERIHRMNAVDEAIAIATLRPFEAVGIGQVAATVKVVTFGVPKEKVDACTAIAAEDGPPLAIAPFRRKRVAFVQTTLPGLKRSVIEKASETMAARLAELGLSIDEERRCPHDAAEVGKALREVAAAGCEIALLLGASAIVDRRDVAPQAIVDAGGRIDHLGMPVDPGHLTLVAALDGMHILGIPGSARSPRLHGFDWLLQRLAAGLEVSEAEITRMGVGGLLKEIHSRPMPREQESADAIDEARIGALLLAAGQSRRMGRVNKLLATVNGAPMVVHVARMLLASRAGPVVVVLGHEPEKVEAALAGLDVSFVRNPDYDSGLSTSLKTGLEALPADVAGAVVALGDMPGVTAADVNALIDAFEPLGGRTICVPVHDGKRGNPVLWARRYFADMAGISGDVGARHLIGENADQVCEVERDNPGILLDLDTPEALAAHRTDNEPA